MIFLREYSEELPTAPVTSPVPQVTVEPVEQEPSWYTGMGDAIWQGACAAYLENQSALKGVVSSAGFGDDEYRAWLDATAAENRRLVRDEYTPDPEKTSVTAQVLYGVSNGLAKYGMAAAVGAAAGPASIAVTPVVFGASVGINETQKLKDEGVDDETATKAGMVSGAMNAFWGGVPGAFGRSIKAKVLTGASLGAFTSYNEMGAIKTVLENADYSKLALKYDPTDPVGMGVNALVGGLMGPVSAGASWKARGSRSAQAAQATGVDAPGLTDVDVEDAARYRATQVAAEANLPVDHGNAEQVREAHQAEATAREQIDAGKTVRVSEKAVDPEVIQEIREKSLAKLAAQSKRDGAILQNRDRSSKESVAQMRGIAAHPDYLRVSISNSLSDGAPVVTDWADIPDIQRGTAVTLVDGTGARYDSQYVVVDADMVITSNDINGQPNNLYGVEGVDAAYAIAGNGRVTALNHAYDLGTADTYKKELMLDAARHGVDPDVIAEMQKPILVRVVDKEKLPVDIADRTNTRTTAEMSMVEQAINDAQRIDLASLKFTEDGNVSLDTISQFVQLMPASERNRLVVNGVPTAEANARLDAAIFQSVYKTPGLTGLLDAGKAPAGVSTMLRAYRALAPKLLDLDGTGDLDVRTAMAEVLNEFVSTRANGQKLSVSELAAQKTTTRSPMAQAYLDYFAKVDKEGGGYKRIVDDISSSAVLIRKNRAMAEADAASGGTSMFGDVTTLSQLDVFSHRTGVEIDEGQFIKTDSLAGAVQFEAERRGQALRDAIDYAMRKEGMAPISAPKPFKLVEVGRDGDKVHRVFGLDGKPDLMAMPEGVDGVLPLPVRLQEGTLNGDHIRKHEKELQQAGYSNVEHALYDVVRNWAWVSKGTKADSLRIVRPIVVDEKGRLTRAVIQVEFQKVAGVYRVGSVFYSKQPIEKETLLFDRQTHDRGLLSLHEGQPQDWHPPATSVGNNKVSGTAVPNESIGQDLGDVKTFKSAAEQEKHVSDAAVIRESIEHVRTSAEDADLKALTNQALIVLEDSPDMVIPLEDANGDPASISAAELIAREDARAAELEKIAIDGVATAVACALVNNGI